MSDANYPTENLYAIEIGNLSNDEGDGNENGKKGNRFVLAKQQLARASRFLHFCAVFERLRRETS